MASVSITRRMDVKELRGLARKEKSGRVVARMLAIANVLSGMSRELSAGLLQGLERFYLRQGTDHLHRLRRLAHHRSEFMRVGITSKTLLMPLQLTSRNRKSVRMVA